MRKIPILTAELKASIEDLKQAQTGDDLKTFTRHSYVISASATEVKTARVFLKQSQSQFADWLGVSVVTVQAWEAGRRKPEAVVTKVIRYAVNHPAWIHEFSAPTLLVQASGPRA